MVLGHMLEDGFEGRIYGGTIALLNDGIPDFQFVRIRILKGKCLSRPGVMRP